VLLGCFLVQFLERLEHLHLVLLAGRLHDQEGFCD
jgi:hypothetical protein